MVTNQLRVAGHLIAKNIIMGVNKEKKKNNTKKDFSKSPKWIN